MAHTDRGHSPEQLPLLLPATQGGGGEYFEAAMFLQAAPTVQQLLALSQGLCSPAQGH